MHRTEMFWKPLVRKSLHEIHQITPDPLATVLGQGCNSFELCQWAFQSQAARPGRSPVCFCQKMMGALFKRVDLDGLGDFLFSHEYLTTNHEGLFVVRRRLD